MTTEIKDFAALLKDHDFTIQHQYVPMRPGEEPRLKWNVQVSIGNMHVLDCEYTAGLGYAPSYPAVIAKEECQDGISRKNGKRIVPSLTDVVSSLFIDAGALDYGCFEDWAADFGFDTDSRRAEAMYRTCIDEGLRLRAALGGAAFDELQDHARSL